MSNFKQNQKAIQTPSENKKSPNSTPYKPPYCKRTAGSPRITLKN